MKTINANSTGAEFIQDLNDNFAECMTGGGDGNISVKVPLQGGELKSSTGYADGKFCSNTPLVVGGSKPSSFTYTDDDYNKYLHTPCYLSLKGNKVKNVIVPTGSTLSIFCYDDTFTLLSGGVVSDEENIPTLAAYVKMQIYNSSGFSQVIPLEMELATEPSWVKNSFTPLSYQFHNYECKPPKLWDDTNYTTPHSLPTGANADADNTRYHDNCFVMLPPNYSPFGEPTKFVIFFQGDGAVTFTGHNPFVGFSGSTVTQSIYEINFKYLNNMGYAVVSPCGYTSMWSGEIGVQQTGYWAPRISPAYIASVRGMYDFLMRNYNFDSAPYLAGKSAGGYMTLYTSATLPFPVRAAAGMSIACSLATSLCRAIIVTQKSMQKRLGCSNWNDFVLNNPGQAATSDNTKATKKTGASSAQIADANRLIANDDIYRKYDQFTVGSDIDYDAYMLEVQNLEEYTETEPPQSFVALLNASHKVMPTPIKLWCATKDPSAPYLLHKMFADWVSQNNGICELRSYTGDDGTHHTFCGGTSGGGKVANNLPTPYGGTMSGVNIGIVEAVEWFKRW